MNNKGGCVYLVHLYQHTMRFSHPYSANMNLSRIVCECVCVWLCAYCVSWHFIMRFTKINGQSFPNQSTQMSVLTLKFITRHRPHRPAPNTFPSDSFSGLLQCRMLKICRMVHSHDQVFMFKSNRIAPTFRDAWNKPWIRRKAIPDLNCLKTRRELSFSGLILPQPVCPWYIHRTSLPVRSALHSDAHNGAFSVIDTICTYAT